MSEKELPAGWVQTTLGEAFSWKSGGTPSRGNPANFGGQIPWAVIGDLTDGPVVSTAEGLSEEGLANSAARWLKPGAVLLAMYGASIGRLGVAKVPLTTNQAIAFSEPSEISSEYLLWYLSARKHDLVNLGQGAAQKNISLEIIRDFPFLLPPLAEQSRIVAEIERHLTRLDAALASLQRVQANLKRYRAAILKAACEGRLVPTEAELARAEGRGYETATQLLAKALEQRRRQWEEQYLAKAEITGKRLHDDWKSSYREPSTLANDLPNLAEGWGWAPIDCLATKVVDGVHKKPDYVDNGIPFVTVRNLTAGPGISLERLNFVSRADHEEFIRRAHPEQGDLLVSKDGTLGVVRAIRTAVEFSIFVSVALIKPVLREMTDYLELALMSPQVQAQMVPKGSGLSHIHLEDLRRDCVPLPPITEQRRIVDEVQRRLSMIEAAEAVVSANLSRATSLRQAILKQAFAGHLVPQDPNDEPASVLLERIRQVRASQAPEPRGRRAKSKPGLAPPSSPPPPIGANFEPPEGAPAQGSRSVVPEGTRNLLSPRWGSGNHDDPQTRGSRPGLQAGAPSGGSKFASTPRPPIRAEEAQPVADPEPEPQEANFLELDREEQLDILWQALLGKGTLEKDTAIRTAADELQALDLARFQRLRHDGPLYDTIAAAIEKGVREGDFDRPRRGCVRALLLDPKDYTDEVWQRCLLAVTGDEPAEIEDTLRAAAEWARETMGLEFARLREDGVILTGLREALGEAVRTGELVRKGGRVWRPAGPTGRETPAQG